LFGATSGADDRRVVGPDDRNAMIDGILAGCRYDGLNPSCLAGYVI
jgi:hypothetical protein